MSRRTVLPVAAAAVIAFGLGAATAPAGASAARLTKNKVEKIASRVVDEKASSLTVARATTAERADRATRADTAGAADTAATAGNALKLDGQDADAYRATTWSVSSVDLLTAPAKGLRWTLDDVPAGGYLMRYDLSFDHFGDSTGKISCNVSFSNGNHNEPVLAVSTSSTATVHGGGDIGFVEGRKVRLTCSTETGQIAIRQPKWDQSSITLTEIQDSRATEVTSETAD